MHNSSQPQPPPPAPPTRPILCLQVVGVHEHGQALVAVVVQPEQRADAHIINAATEGAVLRVRPGGGGGLCNCCARLLPFVLRVHRRGSEHCAGLVRGGPRQQCAGIWW